MKARTSVLLLLAAIVAIGLWHAVDEQAPLRRALTPADSSAATKPDEADDGLRMQDANTATELAAATQAQHAADAALAATRPAARFQPRQMSAANQQRVDKFIAIMEGPDNPSAAYITGVKERLASEAPDAPWARQIQTDLDESFAKHASLLNNLEIADAQCAATVCTFTAVAPVDSTNAPGTDWQTFIAQTFSQPHWRAQLRTTSTAVGGVDGKTVYVTYFERK